MTPAAFEVIALPPDVYSPEQLNALIMESRDVAAVLRQQAALQKAGAKAKPVPTVSEGLHKLVETLTAESVERVSKGLEVVRDTVPTVRLVLAAQPSRQFKMKLVEWFRAEIHPQVLLVFVVRSDIAGGVVVQTTGHVYDFSFKRQLVGAKSRIAELLHV